MPGEPSLRSTEGAGGGPRTIVMGLGNVLLEDDGAGVAALHLLARTACGLDPRVELVDGGTLGLALLDYLEPGGLLILLDAVMADAPPGTVLVLDGDAVIDAAGTRLSPHQVGVADLLAAAEHTGRMPARVVLVGVVPAALGLGLGRTPAVEASLPRMVREVVEELRRAGLRAIEGPGAVARVDVAGALGL